MKKLFAILAVAALFLAATNPDPCEFRAHVAEDIRAASSEGTSLSGWIQQELAATLLGEAARLGTRRTDYVLFSVYTLDPADALPEAVAVEGASWQYVGVGGFFVEMKKPTTRLPNAPVPSGNAPS
jgi:hypothetical protein